jgi:hypothetical protein
MPDPKKKPVQKPVPQTFGLDLPALGELRLEREDPIVENKPLQPSKKEFNEDLIHRLITCVKNM